MPYTPDATDVTNPIEGTVKAVTAAAEFRTIKLYMRDVLLAGLALKAPLASPALTGSVGINMPSPVSMLQLGGTNPVLTIGKQNDGVSYYAGLKIWSQYNITTPSTQISQDTNGTFWSFGGRLEFRDAFSANVVRMCVDTTGNLGVGVSTPLHTLDIGSALASPRLRVASLILGNASSGYPTAGYNATPTSASAWKFDISDSASWIHFNAGSFIFYRSNTGTAGNAIASPEEIMRLDANRNVGIGATATTSAILDVQSTTKGFRLPNMTTPQKNAIAAPAAGLMVFDTTLGKACLYTGSAWQTITSV